MTEKHKHHPAIPAHEADKLAVEIERDAAIIKRFGYKGSFVVLCVAAFLLIFLALYGFISIAKHRGVSNIESQQADAALPTQPVSRIPRPTPPANSVKQLTVAITPGQVAPGGSYTLTATYYNDVGQLVKYNGKLNYQLRFCQLNNSSSCQTSTGAWGDYTLNNGQVVISLPSNTAQGIYNASFMPVGLSGFNWSNEASITVSTGSTGGNPTTGNLVVNGDFEQPVLKHDVEGWDTVPNGTPGLGWKVVWTNPSLHSIACTTAQLEIQDGVNGWTASSGLRYAELDSDCGTGADRGIVTDSLVDISQTLATQAGATYKVSFAFSGRPQTGPGDNILSVYFGGQRIARLVADGGTFNTPDWQNYTYYITATGSQTELKFSGKESQGDSYGIFVDSVEVQKIR